MALLVVVVASYRQTCHAYPNGGGAYAVSRANLGQNASLAAARALLVDYVLTVAVSVSPGVAAITCAVPELAPYAVERSLGFVGRADRDQPARDQGVGRAFAVPTYGFILGVLVMLGGFAGSRFGHGLTAESADVAGRGRSRTPAGSGGVPGACAPSPPAAPR